MAGRGKTRNSQALPKGNSGVYGGTTDPQPGDEQQGGWSRQQREEMDQRFTDAMARAWPGRELNHDRRQRRAAAAVAD